MRRRYLPSRVRGVLSPHEIERLLVITAHPDDVDFGAAGTVATYGAAGVEATYCIVTDGQAGGFDDSIPRAEMASIRRAEQTAAAARVGVSNLVFLGHMDGSVEATMELRHDLARVIRQVRPQVVISQSPQINLHSVYASHPDHVAVGQAAFAAVYPDARNPYAFPELLTSGCEPWSCDELWIMGSGHVVIDPLFSIVDITDQIDIKIAALCEHHSQIRDASQMEQRVREWNAMNAASGGLDDGRYAEAFLVVDTR